LQAAAAPPRSCAYAAQIFAVYLYCEVNTNCGVLYGFE